MKNHSLSDEINNEIIAALIDGKKIAAIKLFREATGAGLKESKEAIDVLIDELSKEHPEMVKLKNGGCSAAAVFIITLPVLIYMLS
jgi:ribosomal protein L7/L12